MLEIDGHLIRTEKAIPVILRDRIGRITLAMIAIDSAPAAEPGRIRPQGSGRLRQARDLFAKVSTHFHCHRGMCGPVNLHTEATGGTKKPGEA